MTARQREGLPHHGTIVAVRGSVVDAHFPPPLPPLNNRLLAGEDNLVVIDVASHVDAATVRGVALTATRGLARGAPVTDTGGPLTVPVGEGVLGRMLNVFGEAIDDQPLPKGLHRRPIHRAALVPGILTYVDDDGRQGLVGIDEGILVKCGDEVRVATARAIRGNDLATLKRLVERWFLEIDDQAAVARSAMARLEAGVIRRFTELKQTP